MATVHVDWKRALLELATIIAGVLIALAANDWRDSVRDRAEGARYQARLDDALGSDLKEYAEAAASAAAVDSAALEVLAVYRGREVPEDRAADFIADVLKASWMPPPAVSADTYNDLVTTGNLRLLPIALREGLGAYYAQVKVYQAREEIFRNRLASGYWSVPAHVLGPEVLPAAWEALAGRTSGEGLDVARLGVSPGQLRAMIRRLRAIPEMEPWIADVRHVMVQREVNYGEHLSERARQVRQVLVGRR
jgi:hypothetical protein